MLNHPQSTSTGKVQDVEQRTFDIPSEMLPTLCPGNCVRNKLLWVVLTLFFWIWPTKIWAVSPHFDISHSFGPGQSVTVGDVNGDGALDLIAGNFGQNVIYLNDGAGHFYTGDQNGEVDCTHPTPSIRCFGPGKDSIQNVAVGDVNGDGALDLITTSLNDPILATPGQDIVYLNDGAGHFYYGPVDCNHPDPNIRCFGTGKDVSGTVVIGDIDGDGALDIIDFGKHVIYLNDGAGHFYYGPVDCNHPDPSIRCFGIGNVNPRGVGVGDVNGDGDLDLIATYSNNCSAIGCRQNVVYLNDGFGRFFAGPVDCIHPDPTIRCFGSGKDDTESVMVGDIDGDGTLDLIVSSHYLSNVVYLNDGAAHFYYGPIDCTHPDPTIRCFGSTDNVYYIGVSLAIGDVNGDGALDLIESKSKDVVYLNDGSGHFFTGLVDCNHPDPTIGCFGTGKNTRSITTGDVNSDGALDLIIISYTQNVIYLNNSAGNFFNDLMDCSHPLTPIRCFGTGQDDTMSIVVGDVNGDGNLDLIAGNFLEQSVVYLNDGAGHFFTGLVDCNHPDPTIRCFGSGSNISGNDNIRTVTVGDVNGDGALDLIAGTEGGENVVYLNDRAGYFYTGSVDCNHPDPSIRCFGTGNDVEQYVAVGDINGDGALDLIASNDGGQNIVYLNDGSGHFFYGPVDCSHPDPTIRCFSGGDYGAYSVTVGDINGDGALDLITGNSYLSNVIYLNDGAGYFYNGAVDCNHPAPTIICFGSSNKRSSGIAVGDVNGDGTLDLIVGNDGGQNTIYLNHAGHFDSGTRDCNQPSSAFLCFGAISDNIQSITVSDVNGDGALDIIAGSYGGQNVVYLNDSSGRFYNGLIDCSHPSIIVRCFGTGNDNTQSVAVGDVNGDGSLDLISGNDGQNAIYLNGSKLTSALAHNPPILTVTRPVTTSNANDYSTPILLDDQIIPITYTLEDRPIIGTLHNRGWGTIAYVAAEYSQDGGGQWRPALATLDTRTTNLSVGHTYTYQWDTFSSGFFGQSDNVIIRLRAYFQAPAGRPAPSGSYHYPNLMAGPFQWPYLSVTTFPFRVRGTQIQIRNSATNQAVPNALVYRWPQGQPKANLMANLSGPYTTNYQGYLRGRGEITPTDTLIALWPFTTTKIYTVYATNITPTITGLTASTVQVPGVQKLIVSPNQPLILFNLSVSLEWDASQDQLYMGQLKADLQRTSEILFDLTNGQAALGNLTIYQDRQHWQDADIRIYATNRLRPHATVGGMVSSLSAYTFTHTLDNGAIAHTTMVYEPGEVEMGVLWNRYGNIGETYSEDWPRTLAHELGHYLFRLLDNYIGLDANQRLKPVDGCPGVMSNPYFSDQSEYHPVKDWSTGYGACKATLSHQFMGQADWRTIKTFFPWLNIPDDEVAIGQQNQGPNSLPIAVTQVRFADAPNSQSLVATQNFTLVRNDGYPYRAGNGARAFLFQNNFTRLVDLGAPRQNLVRSRGARAGDVLCVYEFNLPDESKHMQAFTGCTPVTPNNEELSVSPLASWQPDITIQPTGAYTLNVTVRNVPDNLPLFAHVYPANALTSTLATQAYPLQPIAPGVYAGTLVLTQPVLEAYLHIYVQGNPSQGLVTEYTLGGAPTVRLSEGDVLTYTNGSTVRLSEGDILRLGINDVIIFRPDGQTVRLSEGDTLHLLDGATVRLSEGDTLHLSDGTTVRLSEGDTVRLSEGDAPIRSGDGQVQLFSPRSTFDASDFYTIQPATTLPNQPLYATQIGQAYRITASPNAPAMNDTSISMYYFGRDIETTKEALLRIYFWDEHNDPATGKWQQLPTEVDTEHNYAVAQAHGFGLYMLMYSIENVLYGGQWNLVAYPLQNPMPIAQATSSLLPYDPIFYGYDLTKPFFERWQIYSTKLPDWTNTLSTLQPYQGYWINITNTLTATWQLQDVTAATVGPFPPPATYYGAVQAVADMFTPQAGMTVYAWVGNSLCGVGHTQTQGNAIVYTVAVYGDGPGELAGCGVSHQQVRFTIASTNEVRLIETTADWSNQRPWELPLVPLRNQQALYLPIITLNATYSNRSSDSLTPNPRTIDHSNTIYLPMINNSE